MVIMTAELQNGYRFKTWVDSYINLLKEWKIISALSNSKSGGDKVLSE